jgi:tRNA nucleotidyltransferase (CCA-adding enzyme)
VKIYLVGGAVRDQLLGLPVKERDYVVVGATPEAMLLLGYRPVGKDFPVFLHPDTHEEYALARTERKTGKGYTGFTFHADPAVTLEEDLIRRDLTINAMAQTIDGKIIDPFNGQHDLQNKILRHVSPAFAEDPVRILRLARFASCFVEFQLDPDTLKLMQQMVKAGEVDALVSERVWRELQRALEGQEEQREQQPQRFFTVLRDCGALTILFPEFESALDVALAALALAAKRQLSSRVRFAAMFYHLSVTKTQVLCERLRVPTEFRELALLVAKHHLCYETALEQNAETLVETLMKLDVFRRHERFKEFLLACEANQSSASSPQKKRLEEAFSLTIHITSGSLIRQGLRGEEISNGLKKLRINELEKMLSSRMQ